MLNKKKRTIVYSKTDTIDTSKKIKTADDEPSPLKIGSKSLSKPISKITSKSNSTSSTIIKTNQQISSTTINRSNKMPAKVLKDSIDKNSMDQGVKRPIGKGVKYSMEKHVKDSISYPEVSNSLEDRFYYSILYTLRSNKKHKTFQDGFAFLNGSKCMIYDTDRKVVAQSTIKKDDIIYENEMNMGDKIVMFSDLISKETFDEFFNSSLSDSSATTLSKPLLLSKGSLNNGPLHKPNHMMPKSTKIKKVSPKFDPFAESSFILYHPPKDSDNLVHVVLEPYLSDKMRPHQLEGVKFMYECVTGLRKLDNGDATKGCILADTMGIGKTFQAIALIRTMLTQSPYGFKRPHATKIMVVTPASLVKPWVNEVNKWLGKERIKTIWIGEENKRDTISKIESFLNAKLMPLMIISYEQLRVHMKLLNDAKFDLMICDEGHRLKNPESQTTKSLESIQCEHRIVLTGTPFQNNFNEYYTLINFVNPGCIGTIEY